MTGEEQDRDEGRGIGLRIAPGVRILESDLTWRFSTAGGPGGQHVNTSNTRAEVSLDLASARGLPEWARARLLESLGSVVSSSAGDTRSQSRNRDLARTRLAEKLSGALRVRPPRRPTRPSAAARRRRMEAKSRRASTKRERKPPSADSE
jgi:ribosome-associated protein